MTASARSALPPLPTATPPEQGSTPEGYIARHLDRSIDSRRYVCPSRMYALKTVIDEIDDDPEAREFLSNYQTRLLDDVELVIARRLRDRLRELAKHRK